MEMQDRRIERDMTARQRAEEALRVKTEQLQAITEAMLAFLASGDWRESSGLLLKNALAQTASEYGFIGVVVEGPALRILAHEGIVWDKLTNREFYEQAVRAYREVGYLEFTRFNNLFGNVITTGSAVIANEPDRDPRSGGLPPGHPPLRNFLGVPIYSGSTVTGMIGVANRQGGYTGVEQTQIEILTHAAGVLYDNYRRRQREAVLEEQLRQSQKMEAVGRLAGGVAHDFNNILTAIAGYGDLLVSRLDADDPLRRYAREITSAAQRAGTLTRQLLAFSRRQVLAPTTLDLQAVVANMGTLLRRLIGEDIHLVTVWGPQVGHVRADRGQLEQVLLNLAVNARDAMPHGGTLTIETGGVEWADAGALHRLAAPPGRYVKVAVSDTGCGMDAATQAHIFEPFFTTKGPGQGTGLGLATVYGIVKQSGGYIFVDSALGRGTTFTLYLPWVEADAAAGAPPDALPPLPPGTETILLAEDDVCARRPIQAALQQAGYRVLAAGTPAEALRLAEGQAEPLHLLLTDVVMPQMNGRELAERVGRLHPESRVLYISGYPDGAFGPQGALEAGVAFLQKPFTLDVLARAVRAVLDAPSTAH